MLRHFVINSPPVCSVNELSRIAYEKFIAVPSTLCRFGLSRLPLPSGENLILICAPAAEVGYELEVKIQIAASHDEATTEERDLREREKDGKMLKLMSANNSKIAAFLTYINTSWLARAETAASSSSAASLRKGNTAIGGLSGDHHSLNWPKELN